MTADCISPDWLAQTAIGTVIGCAIFILAVVIWNW